MSSGRLYSRGEWLIPPTLGMKIIPAGPILAISWASCPAPLGIDMVESPSDFAAPSMTSRNRGSVSAGVIARFSSAPKDVPDAAQILRHSSKILSANIRIRASSRSRISSPKITRPGITL
jgi:hypothetical protein